MGLSDLANVYEESLKELNEKGWGDLYKQIVAFILDNLGKRYNDEKSIKLTPKDVEYGDGYFIFAHGDNSVINFRIEEIPGWLFGIWLYPPTEKDPNSIRLDFFSQYEDAIDKFKPSRSQLLVSEQFPLKHEEVKVPSNKEGEEDKTIWKPLKELEDLDIWDVDDINELLIYMYKYPELAFMQDYHGYDLNKEYVDRRTAKRRFEKYKRLHILGEQLKQEYETKVLDFVKERAPMWFDGVEPYLNDRGEDWSPRYELLFPLEDMNATLKEDEEPYEWGSYWVGDKKSALYKDAKVIDKLTKEYKKKAYKTPVWIWEPINIHNITIVPRERIEKIKRYEETGEWEDDEE